MVTRRKRRNPPYEYIYKASYEDEQVKILVSHDLPYILVGVEI